MAVSRGVIGFAIAVLHVTVIYALADLKPTLPDESRLRPVEVVFLASAVADTPPPPLVVKLQEFHPEISPPLLADIEIADTPASDNAITLAYVPQSSAPTASAGAPVLVSQVEYLRAPAPHYPALSKRLHEQGVVVLRVLIDVDGQALRVDVEESSGFERLDLEARNAVQRARFKPWTENGRARQAVVLVPIEFGLGAHTSSG
ncbi:MAG TPA: energy transducer TonB [Steroidobacteraceae bacterium]|nr:energy transducer TonB [Steroidobacteraceae bacterium]